MVETMVVRVSKLKAIYANAQSNYRLTWEKIRELDATDSGYSSMYAVKYADAANWAGQMHAITEIAGAGTTVRWHAENEPVGG